jgi:hypothetical protein
MRRVRRAYLAALVCIGSSTAAFAAAPPQLRNKNVTVNVGLQILQRMADGRTVAPQVQVQYVIYVSKAGRAFVRGTRSINLPSFSAARKQEVAPGQNPSGDAETREMRFESGKLVGSWAFISGAARAVVSFDSTYANCNANVVFGKAGGAPIKWRGFDGQQLEVQSVNVTSQTCTVRDGNPFTN